MADDGSLMQLSRMMCAVRHRPGPRDTQVCPDQTMYPGRGADAKRRFATRSLEMLRCLRRRDDACEGAVAHLAPLAGRGRIARRALARLSNPGEGESPRASMFRICGGSPSPQPSPRQRAGGGGDRKGTRLNSRHSPITYAVL